MKKRLAIFGSSGKMGLGIAELFMQTFALKREDNWSLALIDSDEKALFQSKGKIRSYLQSFGEKKINELRPLYKDIPRLISNREIIDHFIEETFDHLTFSSSIESAKEAEWIFEAIIEDIAAKVSLFKSLKGLVGPDVLFFSNTSAIPIHLLEKKAGLKERILGFHFYNPPTHNPMLEIVASESLKTVALSLAAELNRESVESSDIEGFIGNGFFIRDLKFALNLVEEKKASFAEVDAITEQLLLRPMGVFKLAQFIGLQTTLSIAKIMHIDCSYLTHLQETLEKIDFKTPPYKEFKKHPERIAPFLESMNHPLAKEFLAHSSKIARDLVEQKVAKNLRDVNKVLTVGFQHLYEL